MKNKILSILIVITLIILFISYFTNSFAMGSKKVRTKGIYYDNLQYTENVKIKDVEGVEIDYEANLTNVGDYYEIKFDVINSSKVDVKVKDLLINKDDKYVKYQLTYANGKKIKNGDILRQGEIKSLKYKVTYFNVINDDKYIFDSGFYINYEQIL